MIPEPKNTLNLTSFRQIAPVPPFTQINSLADIDQTEINSAICLHILTNNTARMFPQKNNEAKLIEVINNVIAPASDEQHQQQMPYEQCSIFCPLVAISSSHLPFRGHSVLGPSISPEHMLLSQAAGLSLYHPSLSPFNRAKPPDSTLHQLNPRAPTKAVQL
ncbi:hypothetical protein TYRP_016228 [Tyrophagus putrescentiae]|nr:hypothetical protein TYRP_016228 [Tyrophagus putrescentiae]